MSVHFAYCFCYYIVCPPLTSMAAIFQFHSNPLDASQYGSCSEYVRCFLYRDQHLSNTVPAHLLFHLSRELRDIIPGTQENSTWSKSKTYNSFNCRAIYRFVSKLQQLFHLIQNYYIMFIEITIYLSFHYDMNKSVKKIIFLFSFEWQSRNTVPLTLMILWEKWKQIAKY